MIPRNLWFIQAIERRYGILGRSKLPKWARIAADLLHDYRDAVVVGEILPYTSKQLLMSKLREDIRKLLIHKVRKDGKKIEYRLYSALKSPGCLLCNMSGQIDNKRCGFCLTVETTAGPFEKLDYNDQLDVLLELSEQSGADWNSIRRLALIMKTSQKEKSIDVDSLVDALKKHAGI